MGEVINVKDMAKKEKAALKDKFLFYTQNGHQAPTLATILVGEDPGSKYYLDMQKKVLENLGGTFLKIMLSEDITEKDLIQVIKDLNEDDQVHGIMVLLPLPKSISFDQAAKAMDPRKDVDGVHPLNVGLLASTRQGIAPCTPLSVVTILKETLGTLSGRNAVILGRSNIVGKPLLQLLLREDMTVTICHSRTKDLKQVTSLGDILISAIGRPNMIDGSYVKDGATVIDVGTSELDGEITGDLDLASVVDKAAYVTKVPGGVGTITTTILMRNLLKCYEDILEHREEDTP